MAVTEDPKSKSKSGKKGSAEKQLKIILKRSLVGHPQKHRELVKGLGLRKMNSEVIRKDCPEIRGMINKISFLLQVEELNAK
ncbi:MAG: 50S ribosomal protein L30 [Candidatus Aminicenantes bacterium]